MTVDERKAVLQDVLNFHLSVDEALKRLKDSEWDCELPLVVMTPDQLRAGLELYISGNLSTEALRVWAEFLELREDVGYPSDVDTFISSVLHHIATPETQGDFTLSEAERYLHVLMQ